MLQHCAEALVAASRRRARADLDARRQRPDARAQRERRHRTRLDGRSTRVPIGSLTIGAIAQTRTPLLTSAADIDPPLDDADWARREGSSRLPATRCWSTRSWSASWRSSRTATSRRRRSTRWPRWPTRVASASSASAPRRELARYTRDLEDGARHAAAERRAAGRAGRSAARDAAAGRSGDAREERFPRQHEPRAAHAAERDHSLQRAAAGGGRGSGPDRARSPTCSGFSRPASTCSS